MSGYELWYATELYLNLGGNCIWLPVPSVRSGQIAEIWVFGRHQVQPKVQKGRFLGWDVQWGGGVKDFFKPEEVIHWRYYSPYDPVLGMAPLDAARAAIDQEWWANKYNQCFFKNMAEAGTVVSFPGPYDKTIAMAARESWDQRHQGYNKAKKTAVLFGGATVQELGTKQRDMQFVEQKKWTREETLAVFRVPPVEVGIMDNVSSRVESQRAQRRLFGEEVIAPELKMFEMGIDSVLKESWLVPGVEAWFDTSEVEILQESLGEKIDKAKVLFDMLIPINAIIQKLDLGFEPFSWGNDAYISSTMVPVTSLGGSTPEPTPSEEPNDPEPDDDETDPNAPTAPTAPGGQPGNQLPKGKKSLAPPPNGNGDVGVKSAMTDPGLRSRYDEPVDFRRVRKLKRILFELRNEILSEKDGVGEVDWTRTAKRFETVMPPDASAKVVERLKTWAQDVTKEQVRAVCGMLKNHAPALLVGVGDSEIVEQQPKFEVTDTEEVWRQYDRDILPLEVELERKVRSHVRRLSKEYLDLFVRQNQGAGLETRAREPQMDWVKQDKQLQDLVKPTIEKTVQKMGTCTNVLGKVERATITHVPMTRQVRQEAEKEAQGLAKLLKGQHTQDNEPMDIIVGRNGIEVKTLIQQKNDKITMHPDSLRRKLTFVKKNKLKGHTVAIDMRTGQRQLYYQPGFGSFRIGSMQPVTQAELKKLIGN